MQPTQIHAGKTPHRLHCLAEWAERRGLKQVDIARELDVDKGTVSKWFGGRLPSEAYLAPLAALLELDAPSDLFRHPDDDWLSKLFRSRSGDERERLMTILRAAFPDAA